MTRRSLQLLGAALVVATLAAIPSMATSSSAPPTARAADDDCDNHGPWSRWGDGWYGHDNDGRYWNYGDGRGYFDGHAYWGNCGRFGKVAGSAGAGRVVHVQVAAKRLRGNDRCQHLTRSGLSRIASCDRTHWMRADGIRNWRYDITGDLPRGRYRLHRRAVGSDGDRERADKLHLRIR